MNITSFERPHETGMPFPTPSDVAAEIFTDVTMKPSRSLSKRKDASGQMAYRQRWQSGTRKDGSKYKSKVQKVVSRTIQIGDETIEISERDQAELRHLRGELYYYARNASLHYFRSLEGKAFIVKVS